VYEHTLWLPHEPILTLYPVIWSFD
jgi:hypothetical protein